MNIILSIKPKYCEKIKSGTKTYEFRKSIFKRKIGKVFIYSSSPVQKIIGTFEIDNIINDTPHKLWEICNGSSGLSKSEFFNYFNNTKQGYALKIGKTVFFEP
ncbi:MAG: ASCH domain-containing protein, partial [Candidatus Odinarchaeia archaeon]